VLHHELFVCTIFYVFCQPLLLDWRSRFGRAPILYDEKKQLISLTLTPTVIKKLTDLALIIGDYRSQIEHLLRNITPTQAKKIIDKETEENKVCCAERI
jgi:hypothetical protein